MTSITNKDSFPLRLLKNEPPLGYHIIGAAVGACFSWKSAFIGGVVIPQGYALLTTGYGYLSDFLTSKAVGIQADPTQSSTSSKIFQNNLSTKKPSGSQPPSVSPSWTIPTTVQVAVQPIEMKAKRRTEASPAVSSVSVQIPSHSSTHTLMSSFSNLWDVNKPEKLHKAFKQKEFEEQLDAYNQAFSRYKAYDEHTEFGVIEKRDLPAGSKIFVRADLHGDLKDLMENLTELRKQGLLDDNFRCKPNTHLVFLGDYVDRGPHCMQVLQLLMALKMENPNQVTLIRGNHEDMDFNRNDAQNHPRAGANKDPNYAAILTANLELQNKLSTFYSTLPLTSYLSVPNPSGKREYAQFTHGLFELIDASPLLDSSSPAAQMPIPQSRLYNNNQGPFSSKSKEQSNSVLKLKISNLDQLLVQCISGTVSPAQNPSTCLYQWGDVTEKTKSSIGSAGMREVQVCATDIKDYLDACEGTNSKVGIVFRGHQHQRAHCKHPISRKMVVSTLPVGMESAYQRVFTQQPDVFYVLDTASTLGNWQKTVYRRWPLQAQVPEDKKQTENKGTYSIFESEP